MKKMDIQSRAIELAENINSLIKCKASDQYNFKAVHSPINFGKNANEYIQECLRTTWVSSGGGFVEKFAKKLSEYMGTPFVVPVSSGTAALKLGLIGLGVDSGDEVLLPSFTFVASANSISHIGAIPHFVDIESKTFGIDPIKLENYLSEKVVFRNKKTINKDTGAKIAALLAVHVYGNSCNIFELSKICEKYNIKLIEDCAGALGTFSKKNSAFKHVGRFGDLGCLSFNGNKIITTGGGGAVFTESRELYEKILHISTTARVPHPYEIEHDQIGWNDRMPNLNAALGLSQMEIFHEILKVKENIYRIYEKHFIDNNGYTFAKHNQFGKSNFWLNSLLINENRDLSKFKSTLYQQLISKNIQIRAGWKPINSLKMYHNNPSDNCSTANKIASQIINLPSSFVPVA